MKSAEQWNEHGREVGWDSHLDSHVVRAIQADALRHAAEICKKHGDSFKGSTDGFGAGWTVLASGECRDLILSAAEQLEKD